MSSSTHFCSVCRSSYRGHSSVHLSTAKHRANANRGQTHHADMRSSSKQGRIRGSRLRRDYEGQDHVKVKPHRRRLPEDGPRRVVKVRRYWRERPSSILGATARQLREWADLRRFAR